MNENKPDPTDPRNAAVQSAPTEQIAVVLAAVLPWILKLNDMQTIVAGAVAAVYIICRTWDKHAAKSGAASVLVAEATGPTPAPVVAVIQPPPVSP